MFQLTSHSVVQFISIIIFVVLISFILYSKQVRLKRLFVIFLTAGLGISLASLLMNMRLPYEQTVFWKMLLPFLTTWSIIAYVHFVTAYAERDTKPIIKLGYAWLCVSFVIVAFGYITTGLNLISNDFITMNYGILLNMLVIVNDLVMLLMAWHVIRMFQNANEPEARNRAAYLLAGLGFMITANVFKYIIQDYYYLFSCIGCLGNALVILYTLLRYRLLDIQVLMRKWMVYTGVTVCVTLAYLALLLGLSNLLRLLPPQLGIPATIVMVVLFGYVFNWVKGALDKAADKLFYGSRYVHRQMLLNFAGKMGNFINIKDIANALILPLVKTVRAQQIGLLLPYNGHFTAKFIARLNDNEQIVSVMLEQNSQLTRWLEENGTPLMLDGLETSEDFSHLSDDDRIAIDTFQMAVLCPIISKHKLVGILALSTKDGNGHYTREEIDLMSMLASESAVAIENAQIYTSAKEKANTDELTGLYNHRYFQEGLNQEIESCSHSLDDFSLLFIDLDFFKNYNDIYGHVLGDEILKEVGQIIKGCIRETDIGGRYGGDEFAVILKGTSCDNAKIIAERIRSNLESAMNEKGFLLTCSIGVACWRTDGVVRGAIVEAADKAVYAAKQAGRNRICVSSKKDSVETIQPETALSTGSSAGVESIVFALASTVDARDHYTYGHSKAVSKYATELARAVGYTNDGVRRIRSSALLHDIGKLSLPDSVLTKREPLTAEEWEMIKNHPQLGLGILKYVVGLRDCIDAVLYHHERYDGNGYPRGLKGEEIPMDARIMAIADAYDAMTSERSYKTGSLSEEEAIEELKRCSGTQFDPDLVETFSKLRREFLISASYGAAA